MDQSLEFLIVSRLRALTGESRPGCVLARAREIPSTETPVALEPRDLERYRGMTPGTRRAEFVEGRVCLAELRAEFDLRINPNVSDVLALSLSHTQGWVFAAGLAVQAQEGGQTEGGLGIDVEVVDRTVSARLAARVLTEAEKRLFCQTSKTPLEAWVIKEACLKADFPPAEGGPLITNYRIQATLGLALNLKGKQFRYEVIQVKGWLIALAHRSGHG